jgi:4-amino-4-deoxy-L-arabinose transferase-like glycosyltransferase
MEAGVNEWKKSLRDPVLGGILILAFLVRFLGVPLVHQSGSTSDEREYVFLAKNLLSGVGFTDSNGTQSVRAPLFPGILAGLLLLDGGTLSLGYVLNVFCGALAVWLVYLLTIAAGGNLAASRWAAGLAAFFPGLVIYSTLLQTEALYIVFFLAAVLMALHLARTPAIGNAILLGVAAGLAGLTRAVFVPFFPFLLLAVAGGQVRAGYRKFLPVVAALLVFIVVLLPWGIRNYSLHGKVIFVSTFAGPSLLLGNNPFSHGTTRLDDGFDEWFARRVEDRTGKAREELTEAAWSEVSGEIARDYIREHPGKWLSLLLRKAQVMLVYPITHTDAFPPVQMLAVCAEAFLLLAAMLGLLTPVPARLPAAQEGSRAGRERSGTLAWLAVAVLFFLLVHTLLHAEARYRLPLVPLLCILAGVGLAHPVSGLNRWSAWKVRRRVCLALVWVCIISLYGVTGWMYINGMIT